MLPEEGLSRSLELLDPARDADTAIAAVDHGADAIYIGASHFGARKQAGSSLQELSRLIAYAHRFKARVYVTLNTLLYDNELEAAHKLIWELYQLGADALIVQDMGILQMDLPPLPLHASTQTNNRSLEKVLFLEQAGFQQVVLARELNLQQIAHISQNTRVPLEFFIHGALCVSYSGQCYMSHHLNGRSANRGECSQPCRQAYDLQTEDGKTLVRDQHLLSLKDLNLSHQLRQLVDAGISSFKIEGRLKDPAYVKNITAHYRKLLDDLIEQDTRLSRSSSGRVQTAFTPEPQKSFSRGFTIYFVEGRQKSIWSPHTPKSLGEKITTTNPATTGQMGRHPLRVGESGVRLAASPLFTRGLSQPIASAGRRKAPAPGFELEAPKGPKKVMTTKHCIRHATDQCPKENPGASAAPLLLKSGKNNYRLIFDCKNCEMQIFTQD